MSDRLSELTAAVLQFREERDWKQFHNPKDQLLSLALEAAEVLELAQWKEGDELEAHLREKHEDLADELSDVLAWVLLIASDRGIDLGEAFAAKLVKNARKYPVARSRGRATKYDQLKGSGGPSSDT